eukprot:599729-Amphidinium_carterae.2
MGSSALCHVETKDQAPAKRCRTERKCCIPARHMFALTRVAPSSKKTQCTPSIDHPTLHMTKQDANQPYDTKKEKPKLQPGTAAKWQVAWTVLQAHAHVY